MEEIVKREQEHALASASYALALKVNKCLELSQAARSLRLRLALAAAFAPQ